MIGNIVNKQQLAQIFGVSQKNIDKWTGEGLPLEFLGANGENRYNTARVFVWLLSKHQRQILNRQVDIDIDAERLPA